jgi:signal transduction histidine kinase
LLRKPRHGSWAYQFRLSRGGQQYRRGGFKTQSDAHEAMQQARVELSKPTAKADEPSLSTGEWLRFTDPESAARLLAEAKSLTLTALDDLRSVVRGIHPPALVDRGLVGGVEALAVQLAVPVTVADHLSGRPPASVEAAAYFAVAECLANALKHAGATRVTVALTHDGRALRLVVRDDGAGGATVVAGGGLDGVARRLRAFDGSMELDSPRGGPTTVRLEIPCALSSPRTTPSSVRD